VISTSHTRGVQSQVKVVVVNWSGASDSGSGVDGFSYHWDTSPATVADSIKDVEESAASATSQPLSPGTYYFHLRTRDNEGNWSPGVHLGPFVIQAPPAPPPVVRCVVPRLAGKTLAAARTALARSRCALGRVTRRRSRVRRGRVVAQSRRPGTRLARGTRIGLTLSRGRR
jgi:PASTA domain